MAPKPQTQATGQIAQVLGAVVDITFPDGNVPAILNAITAENDGKTLVMEVAQHLGDNTVRAIAMDATEGLTRGAPVTDTGAPITVPVGPAVLGRIIDVIGQPIDECGPLTSQDNYPIHRSAPEFVDQATETEQLVTGIKVIDLLCPYTKGGKTGLFGGAGRAVGGQAGGARADLRQNRRHHHPLVDDVAGCQFEDVAACPVGRQNVPRGRQRQDAVGGVVHDRLPMGLNLLRLSLPRLGELDGFA